MSAADALLVGIFVGGRATRMGGRDKTRARRPDGTRIVDHLVAVASEAFGEVPIVLVGQDAPAPETELPTLVDDPPGTGPIGGLAALLDRGAAEGRNVVALAGDQPFLTPALLRRLLSESAGADAVAPRPDGIWQPLCAWYRAEVARAATRATLERGRHALRDVLDALDARALELDDAERAALRDWDTPEAVSRDGGSL